MQEKTLTISVQEFSCIFCGNKWTHSQVTYSNGGTPAANEVKSLPLVSMRSYTCLTPRCFSCVPIDLLTNPTSVPIPVPTPTAITTKLPKGSKRTISSSDLFKD